MYIVEVLKLKTVASFFRFIVVNIGHMLGLDQEREELGEKPVSYLYGDLSFKCVCLFVCV